MPFSNVCRKPEAPPQENSEQNYVESHCQNICTNPYYSSCIEHGINSTLTVISIIKPQNSPVLAKPSVS
jgi:hypothetical protein